MKTKKRASKAISLTSNGYFQWFTIGMSALLITVILAMFSDPLSAAEPRRASRNGVSSSSVAKFDHLKTGYPLVGAHLTTRCETCHLNGVFKGTPRQCDNCHAPGNRFDATAKPTKHISTTDACDRCHTAVVWAPVRFSHAQVVPGSCATCHNTVMASGKPSNHIQTNASCDKCHNTSFWTTTSFTHDATSVGNCSNCHGGAGPGIGQSSGHIPLMGGIVQCDGCHISTTAFSSRRMDHSGLNGQCSTCHKGAYISQNAQTFSPTHAAGQSPAQCDSCHKSTTDWTTATSFTHDATTTGKCSTCHNSAGSGLPMGSTHIAIGTVQCDTCHTSTSSFLTRTMNHASVSATACATCHNGSFTSENADGRGTAHIPLLGTATACNACHTSQTVWTQRNMDHGGLNGQCSTCHKGAYVSENALTFSPTHSAGLNPAQCDTCHKGFTSWATATFVHDATTTGKCNTCHMNGGSGLPVGTTHIPIGTVQCDTCHGSTTSFLTRNMNHAAVSVTACATCHNGGFASEGADARGSGHIPLLGTATACNGCHASQTVWTQRSMDHGGLAGQCSTCHKGAYLSENAQTFSSTHPAGQSPAQCDSCHKSLTDWTASTTFTHDATAKGTCNTCHKTGGSGLPPGSTHIPVASVQCDTCHGSYSSFLTRTMNHPAVASTACATCHSGGYTSENADGKGATHIPLIGTATTCGSCHTSQTVWTQRTMDHGGLAGQCSTCHKGAYVSENALTYSSTHAGGQSPAQCDSCHKSTTDWSSSTAFTHDATTKGTCNTCHKTGGSGMAMGSTHIPIGSVQCDTCHTSTSTGGFLTRTMIHTAVVATACATCHSGGYTSENADGKGTTHIPIIGTATTCNGCHTSQTVWTQRTMDHGGLAGQCSTCHKGAYLSENALTYSATHAGGQAPGQCDTCHKSTTDWTTATSFTHDATTVGKCNTCHKTGGAGLPPGVTHIPITGIQCDNCHTVTTTGGFLTRSMNHTVVAATACSTCHGGSYVSENALAKPTNHIPDATVGTLACNSCHTSTAGTTAAAWDIEKMNHNNMQQGCRNCHLSGTNYMGKMSTKALNHNSKTTTATDCSFSGCHKPLGKTGSPYTSWGG